MQRQDILERLFVEYFRRETVAFNNKDVETKYVYHLRGDQ